MVLALVAVPGVLLVELLRLAEELQTVVELGLNGLDFLLCVGRLPLSEFLVA